MVPERESVLFRAIIGAFYDVYNALDFGLLECHYCTALERKLRQRGLAVSREHAVKVFFEGEEIGFHRLDMVVDGVIVVEVKATPVLHPIARRQLYNYLRVTNLSAGLLLHFGPVPKFQKVFLLKPRS